MLILVRALTYAALFVGLALVFLPGRLLSSWGIEQPAAIQLLQVLGLVVGLGGAGLALWCVVTFAFVGRGTPLPFDPPAATRGAGSLPVRAQPHGRRRCAHAKGE